MKIRRLIYCLVVTVAFLLVSMNYGGLIQSPIQREAVAGERTKLYLVSTGPGDADLITVRGMKAIKDADLIVCSKRSQEKFASYLKGKEIFDTSRFYKSSRKDYKDLTEKELKERREEFRKRRKEIEKAVRQAIKKGKTAAILQGADPFIYQGGGQACEQYDDLNPVVIPGLSSFNAANAALGRTVTSGEHTHSVILTMPGWSKRKEGPAHMDTIESLATHRATMAIFMNRDLKNLMARLSTYYPPQTPIGIVVYAGYKEKERVIKGTIETIVDKVGSEKLPFEHLIYVGDFLTNRYDRSNKGK